MATITSNLEATAALEKARMTTDEQAARLERIHAQVVELNARVLECLADQERLEDEAARLGS